MAQQTPKTPPTSGIRIDMVRISHFRSLRNIEVELSDTCLLVGMNNSGKTTFLRALHLALGSDRRLISLEDFFIDGAGLQATQILIDVRIIPVATNGSRAPQFPSPWIESDFGGGNLISTESNDNEFIAVRTAITYDAVKSDFILDRSRLQEWSAFETWMETKPSGKVPRFSQLVSYFIDAQRDVIADLRTRSSYFGKMLSKIEIPEAAIAELEEKLAALNEDIVGKSEVLSHVRDTLSSLNRTVSASGEGVELTPVSKKLRDLTKGLGVQFTDSVGSSFPLESHGMGTRSWASILSFEAYVNWTAKLSEKGGVPFHPVLFLEEPEAHLHPNAQRAVHDQISNGVGQRIVSTHSPYIAGQADISEILHFSKHGSETQVRRLSVGGLNTEEIRKIRREVMRSRGELLFASAVVLFEGETEEQALPMFARHHWGRHPFERGVSFVGVGGDGNYFPFIRIFEAFQIPWFIFSDGEPAARGAVTNALTKAGLTSSHSQVVTLPNDHAIEDYLIDQGYTSELKNAAIECLKPFSSPQYELAKTTEILAWTDEAVASYLKANKTAMATHWARSITRASGERSLPIAIRELLDAVDQTLDGTRNSTEPTS